MRSSAVYTARTHGASDAQDCDTIHKNHHKFSMCSDRDISRATLAESGCAGNKKSLTVQGLHVFGGEISGATFAENCCANNSMTQSHKQKNPDKAEV